MSGDFNEHRFIIATANNGRGMTTLYNCTVGVEIESTLYQFQDHLRLGDTVEEVYSSRGGTTSIFTGIHTKFFKMLSNKYGDKGKWPALMKGQVYRVDVFVNTCYLDVEPKNSITSMSLVWCLWIFLLFEHATNLWVLTPHRFPK